MRVEIKRKPVNNLAKVVKLIQMYNDNGIWGLEKILAFADKINSFYSSGDEGEAESVEIDPEFGARVVLSPINKEINLRIEVGNFCSITQMTKSEAIFFAKGIIGMCEQME